MTYCCFPPKNICICLTKKNACEYFYLLIRTFHASLAKHLFVSFLSYFEKQPLNLLLFTRNLILTKITLFLAGKRAKRNLEMFNCPGFKLHCWYNFLLI